MARKVGQIIARGDRRWFIRVYLGRDRQTNKRHYHNRTIHGPMREAQAYLTRKLRERDLGRDLEGEKITLNEYLDRWIHTAVKPRVREKTCQDYEGMLRRYVRPTWAKEHSRQCVLWIPKRSSANDGARSVRSDHPLRTRCHTICHAACPAMALVA